MPYVDVPFAGQLPASAATVWPSSESVYVQILVELDNRELPLGKVVQLPLRKVVPLPKAHSSLLLMWMVLLNQHCYFQGLLSLFKSRSELSTVHYQYICLCDKNVGRTIACLRACLN